MISQEDINKEFLENIQEFRDGNSLNIDGFEKLMEAKKDWAEMQAGLIKDGAQTEDSSEDTVVIEDSSVPKTFISYAHEDKLHSIIIAEKIKNKRLAVKGEKKRMNTFIDRQNIHGGDTLIKEITDAINSSAFYIVLLSEHSVKSDWVDYELTQAKQKEIDEPDSFHLIPIKLDECEVPDVIKTDKYLDLRKNDHEYITEQLIDSMEDFYRDI